MHYGDYLEKSVHATAGAQVFVAADIPRAPQNESNAPCVMAVVHASGSD